MAKGRVRVDPTELRAEGEEMRRLLLLREPELRARARGARLVAGVDEAGRGPLAGPVVAAAVILPVDALIPGLDDSKRLTEARRRRAFRRVADVALDLAVGVAGPAEIDRLNIRRASQEAMRRAVAGLTLPVDHVICDGNDPPDLDVSCEGLIDGDVLSACVAAASIVAKVARDQLMVLVDQFYPHYGFARHKGYGTRRHLRALARHGPCPLHRRTFAPVREAGPQLVRAW